MVWGVIPACKQSSQNQQVVASVSKGFGCLYLQAHSLRWGSEEWFWFAMRPPITQGDLQSKQPVPSIPTTQQRASNVVGQLLVSMLKPPTDPKFPHVSWYAIEFRHQTQHRLCMFLCLGFSKNKTTIVLANQNKITTQYNDVSVVSSQPVQFLNRQAPDLISRQTQ